MADASGETKQGAFRPDLLAGQTAIITGGGSGLGFGIARSLTAHGARVVLAARKIERLEAAAKALTDAGNHAIAVRCDIRDPDQVEAMVQQAEEAYGRIHILVNNAGATFWSKAEELSPNGWRSVIDIDVNGTFFCSQAVAHRMIRDGGGSMVMITSTSPWTGNPNRANGGAGKAAVSSMVKSLAVEWGPYGIRINEIAPAVPTEATTTQLGGGTSSDDEVIPSKNPLRRMGRLEDVGNATLFLVSEAASFITGNVIVVDGGGWFASKRGGKEE